MKLPKMILFDYGQTLAAEKSFDGVKGTAAVLEYATVNKHGMTAEEVQAYADTVNKELGRFDLVMRYEKPVETPNSMFCPFLYESLGIELSIDGAERDTVFWDAAAPGTPTEGIGEFLAFLRQRGVRTGVVSNICYDSAAVAGRIDRLLPDNDFEFILATSRYLFRKPSRHIFELALEKADLRPEDVWYVGDNYIADVKGAAGAGIFPVWYTGALTLPHEPDDSVLTVSSWAELRALLA